MLNTYGSSPILAMFNGTIGDGVLTTYSAYGCEPFVPATGQLTLMMNTGVDSSTVLPQVTVFDTTNTPIQVNVVFGIGVEDNQIQFTFGELGNLDPGADLISIVVYGCYDEIDVNNQGLP